MSTHRFCREVCLERGEPLAGTGSAPTRMLMLAWPRGKWRVPRWESVGMSEPLSRSVHAAAQAGVHVALVDKVGESESLPTLEAQPEGICATFASEPELIAAIDKYVEGKVFEGEPDDRTTIVCCTDSRRDACCARYGFSTYKALVAIADPARFHIVQATHIGGCRFAASLLVMPNRHRYGRMTAGHVPAFLASLERDEIYLPAFKGSPDLQQTEQVAEIAARTWAYEHGADASLLTLEVPPLSADVPEGASLLAHAHLPGATLDIRMRAQNLLVQGNCEAVANEGGEPVLRWSVDRLTASNIPTGGDNP